MSNPLRNPAIRTEFGFDLDQRVKELKGQWNSGLTEEEKSRVIPYQISWDMISDEKMALAMDGEKQRHPGTEGHTLLKLFLLERFFWELRNVTYFEYQFIGSGKIKPPFEERGNSISRIGSDGASRESLSRLVLLENEEENYIIGCRLYASHAFHYDRLLDMSKRIAGAKENVFFMGVMAMNQFADLCNPRMVGKNQEKIRYTRHYLAADRENYLLVFSKTNDEIMEKLNDILDFFEEKHFRQIPSGSHGD